MMVSTALAGILLAGVMSSFILIARSGFNIGSYAVMESQARTSLEQFAQDVRQADQITWHSATSITLRVQGENVNYQLITAGNEAVFQRNARALVTGIIPSTFSLIPYSVAGHEIPFSVNPGTGRPAPTADERADADRMTKQLQLSLEARRSRASVATATNTVLSARFILRNKRVTT
jgi:hypothetical protein